MSKYFNTKPMGYRKRQQVANRRDADRLIESSHQAFMLLALMTLHNEFGFGSNRLERFAEAWQTELERYNRGELTLDGMSRIISEDYGIEYVIR